MTIPYSLLQTVSDREAERLSIAGLVAECECEVVTSTHLQTDPPVALYGSFDRPNGFQWLAIGGQSTGHTEALRIVSGSEAGVHPAGWPGFQYTALQLPAGYDPATPLRLTASDLAALSSGFETIEQQQESSWVADRGMYGNGY